MALTEREVLVRIHPGNEGPMALMAVAPVLHAECLRAQLVPGTQPGERSRLEVEIEVARLFVRGGPTRDLDRERVESAVRDRILDGERFPLIRYRGLVQMPDAADGVIVSGELEIRGRAVPLDLLFHRLPGGSWRTECVVRQTAFGIEPMTAFVGALRSRDEVRIEIVVHE